MVVPVTGAGVAPPTIPFTSPVNIAALSLPLFKSNTLLLLLPVPILNTSPPVRLPVTFPVKFEVLPSPIKSLLVPSGLLILPCKSAASIPLR